MHWGNSKDCPMIFKLQKRALRSISNRMPRDSCRPLFKQLKIMPFPTMYIFQTILFVKQNIDHFLNNNKLVHVHNTRNKNILQIPKHKHKFFERSVTFSGIKFYNAIPESIQNITKYSTFKNSLKNFMIDGCFYSNEEFFQKCASI